MAARRCFRTTCRSSLLGAGLLWFGWFGFNAGSALGANGIAGLAFANTMLAPMGTLVVWTLLDVVRTGRVTAVGGATAIVVGLVAITPAAGYISPMSSISPRRHWRRSRATSRSSSGPARDWTTRSTWSPRTASAAPSARC